MPGAISDQRYRPPVVLIVFNWLAAVTSVAMLLVIKDASPKDMITIVSATEVLMAVLLATLFLTVGALGWSMHPVPTPRPLWQKLAVWLPLAIVVGVVLLIIPYSVF